MGWRRQGSELVAWVRLWWLCRQPVGWLEACRTGRAGPGGVESGPNQGQWQMLVPVPTLGFSLSRRDCDLHCVHTWLWDRVSTGTEDGQGVHGLKGMWGTVKTGLGLCDLGGFKALLLS